jgi:ABC-type oligopeptide transport system substrate-binding subunit
VDLLLYTWFPDYADPSNFVNTLFDPASQAVPLHPYDDPRYVARMRDAYDVTGGKRAATYRTLATDMMRDSPPSAQYAAARRPPQIFSKRVGCQVFRPQDDGLVDLAALCLK